MTVEELQVLITAKTSGLQTQLNQVTKQLQATQKNTQVMTNKMTSAFSGFKRAFVALGIGKAIAGAFNLTRTYEASVQQVNRLFGLHSGALEKWIQQNAKTFGMARADAMKYASIYGNLVRAFEQDGSKMTQYTTDLMKATTIIASSTGRTVQDVSERIRSGILGNTEAIEDLGIYAQVAMLKTTNAFKQIADGRSWDKLTFQEQQQVRVLSILEQASSQFGDNIQNNMNYQLMQLTATLKNVALNIGQAFMPIVSVVVPILNTMANALEVVTAKLATFMNALFGTNFNAGAGVNANTSQSFTNMGNEAQKAGNEAEKAGKKAQKALMGFDEVNTLNGDSGDGGSGAGGNAGGAIGDAVQPTEGALEQAATTFADKLKSELDRIKSLFKEGFEIGIGGDWKERLEELKQSIEGIKSKLKNIFTDNEVVTSFNGLIDKFIIRIGQEAGSLVSIGTTIGQNLLGGFDKYLEQNQQFIKDRLVGILNVAGEIQELAGDYAVAFADIFSVFDGETGQQITANIIGMFSNGFLGAVELGLRFGKDILNVITEPFINNKDIIATSLENTLKPIETITASLKKTVDDTFMTFKTTYDTYIAPAFTNITEGFSSLVATVNENYNAYIVPVLNGLAEKFESFMSGPWQGMIDSVITNMGKIIENASILWKDTLEPMIANLTTALAPVLGEIINKFGEFALILGGGLADAISDVANWLGDISDWCVENQGVIADIVAVVSAWAVAWGLYEGALLLANIATGAWGVISAVAAGATTALSTAIAILTSPITLVIAAIAAIIAIVVLLIRHWDDVAAVGKACWDKIVEAWNNASKWFNDNVVEPVKRFFTELWLTIQQKAELAWTFIKGVWLGVTSWFKETIIQPVEKAFTGMWNGVKEVCGDTWTGIKDIWNTVEGWFDTTIIKPVSTAFSTMWNGIKTSCTNAFNGIKDAVRTPLNFVIDMVNKVIRGLNRLKIDLPDWDWIPDEYQGKSWGIDLDPIPKLARGGIVDGATFMGNYVAGEAGKEMIVPLENTSFVNKLAGALGNAVMMAMQMSNGNTNSGDTPIILELDGREIARGLINPLKKETERIGVSFG